MTRWKRTTSPWILPLLCIAVLGVLSRAASAQTAGPDVLGIRLGMPLTAAKPFLKKITKPKSCKIGPWERDGSAEVSCEGLKLVVVAGKSADERLIAALNLSTVQGGGHFIDKVQKKNGPPCATKESHEDGSSAFWRYDENGVKATDDSAQCMPVLPEDTASWSANKASCAPGDRGSYILTTDLTSYYYRHEDDLGVEIWMVGCGMLAKAKPQLLPIPPRPRNQ